MNKNGPAAGPPSVALPKTAASPETGNPGPLPEAPQGHDPTLKWCIPDPRGNRDPSPPVAMPASGTAGIKENVGTASLPAAHGESAVKGALPEAIQESTPDRSSPRGESFEIIVADGPAGVGEAETLGTPELAATPPPKREAELVTPPPRRDTELVTPPPRRETEVVTPPPKRETEAATPPPKPATTLRPVAGSGGTVAPGRVASQSTAQTSAATGALPEAPIRMVESGEVKDGEFEVMDPGDTPSSPLPTTPTPPPVPAISAVLPTTSQPPRAESPLRESGPVVGARAEDSASEVLPLPEALSRRPLKKRLKPWFEEVFDENYLRTLPFMTAQQTMRETAFVKEALSPPAEGEVLDIACGYGRHAIELGQRGFRVTGLDLSLPLLIRAADEAQRRGLSVNFVHTDMREMTYENRFDAAYCVLTSFGYFDEETNLRVATSICRALKPGGRFLVDTINRDYIVSDLPSRVWWEGDGCVVLEEVDFDFHTSRVLIRRSIVFGDGRQMESEISIRAYSLHELGRVLRRAGFQILEASGSLEHREPFLGAAARHVVLVCERPLT